MPPTRSQTGKHASGQGLDEGDGSASARTGRDLEGAAGRARVVDRILQPHGASQAHRHRPGVPIIHGDAVVLVEDDRHTPVLPNGDTAKRIPLASTKLCRPGGLVGMNHCGAPLLLFIYSLLVRTLETLLSYVVDILLAVLE